MNEREKILRRFDALLEEADRLDQEKLYVKGTYRSGYVVNDSLFTTWRIRSEHLLAELGESYALHLNHFRKKSINSVDISDHETLVFLRATIEAARDDFMNNIRSLCSSLYVRRVMSNNLCAAKKALALKNIRASILISSLTVDFFVLTLCADNGIEYDGAVPSFKRLVDVGMVDQKQLSLLQDLIYNIGIAKRINAGRYNEAKREKVSNIISAIDRLVSVNSGILMLEIAKERRLERDKQQNKNSLDFKQQQILRD